MEFIAERGFLAEKQSEEFAAAVTALGWKEFVKHRKDFIVPLVREFYAGIPDPVDGKKADFSMVRGEKVNFDPRTINEKFRLGYFGKAIENKALRFGRSEMEEVKERVCIDDAVWEKFGSEYKLLKTHLCDEAKMWFNFIKRSLMPTSHTTNVEKDRLIVLDAILARENIDVGRLIFKEIDKCRTKREGNLYFPFLITDLCIDAGVEVEPSEERRSPWGAFPTKFKPRQKAAAISSGDAKALQRLTLQQQALSKFVKEKFEWEKTMFAQLTRGKSTVAPPEFPDWVVEEEREEEAAEVEIVKEKKKRMRSPAKKKQSPVKKKKKVSSEEEEWNSDDLDNLSQNDEEETKELMKQISSEEESEESSEGEEAGSDATDIQCDEIPNPKRPTLSPTHDPTPIPNTIPVPEPHESQPNPSTQTQPPPPPETNHPQPISPPIPTQPTQAEIIPPSQQSELEKPVADQPQQQPIQEEPTNSSAVAADATASSIPQGVQQAVTPPKQGRTKTMARKRVPSYHYGRASPGAKLSVCSDDEAEKAAGTVAGDAIASQGKPQEENPAEKEVVADGPALQDAEKEAAAKMAEMQAAKNAGAEKEDATTSSAVAVDPEAAKTKEEKKKKVAKASPVTKRQSNRIRSGIPKK